MEMVSTNYVDLRAQLLAAGQITLDQIEDAVRRILLVKFRLGLFDHPYIDQAGAVTAPQPAAHAAARRRRRPVAWCC